jgi:hypothetical protein
MIFYMRKWVERSKYVLVFFIFTYALYHLFVTVTQWIEPTQRYKEPVGKAIKVFNHHASITDHGSMGERLKLFYWMGE